MKKNIRIIFMISILVLATLFLFLAIQRSNMRRQIPYDPLYSRQWYLQNKAQNIIIPPARIDHTDFTTEEIILNSNVNLGVTDFWESYQKKSSKELTIAILDSCADIRHDDLKTHIWINNGEIADNGLDDDGNGYIDDYYGWNFYSNTNIVYGTDENAAHGTHCAGIIAAAHNGSGIMGILGNTNVKLMVLPIYGGEELNADNLVSAIHYADIMGADICNISCVFHDGKDKISDVIQNSSMYFVAAAGNFQNQYINGLNLDNYERFPACCQNSRMITARSINAQKKGSLFSNYSPNFVDIAAPGEYIYSTLPNGDYRYQNGTSLSAPIVTGILGAYYYLYTDTIEEAVELLLSNAETDAALQEKIYQGRIVKFASPIK